MNKFVELSPELNFHANWHLLFVVKFVFDSIYLCTLMSAILISSGMYISIACNRTLSDPFGALGWLVELRVCEVSMFFLTLLEAAIMMPMIRSTLTSSNAKHVVGFRNLKREGVFCSSIEPIYPIVSVVNTTVYNSMKSLLSAIAGYCRIIIWFTQGSQCSMTLFFHHPRQFKLSATVSLL